MDSREVVKDFAAIDKDTAFKAKLIDGQNLYEYEKEYNVDIVHFTDKILFDIFITKKKYYRMSHLSRLLTAYNTFYDYCCEKGYINENPLEDSMYFNTDYLITKIASMGNVELYSREYIRKKCEQMEYNVPYYLSIALLLYEGVYDIATLTSIKYSDVNFEEKTIRHDDLIIKISDELALEIEKMYRLDKFETLVKRGEKSYIKTKEFYDENGVLIRQVARSKTASNNFASQTRAILNKLSFTGLDGTFLYDSGLLKKLVDEIGLGKFLDIMEFETKNRRSQEDVLLLQSLFDKWGVRVSVKNFVFNYRVYVPLLKHNKIL